MFIKKVNESDKTLGRVNTKRKKKCTNYSYEELKVFTIDSITIKII